MANNNKIFDYIYSVLVILSYAFWLYIGFNFIYYFWRELFNIFEYIVICLTFFVVWRDISNRLIKCFVNDDYQTVLRTY